MFSISKRFLNQNLSMYLTKHQTTYESHTACALKGMQVPAVNTRDPQTCWSRLMTFLSWGRKLKCSGKKGKVGCAWSFFSKCCKRRGNGLSTWALALQAWKSPCSHGDACEWSKRLAPWKSTLCGVKKSECMFLIIFFQKNKYVALCMAQFLWACLCPHRRSVTFVFQKNLFLGAFVKESWKKL